MSAASLFIVTVSEVPDTCATNPEPPQLNFGLVGSVVSTRPTYRTPAATLPATIPPLGPAPPAPPAPTAPPAPPVPVCMMLASLEPVVVELLPPAPGDSVPPIPP